MTRKAVWANSDGLRVGFGPNQADFSSVAEHKTEGVNKELRFVLDGEKFSSGTYQFDATEALPIGVIPTYAHVRVTEVFNLGGTTPTIQIGDAGDADRWGALSEANAEAVGTYTLSVAATPLAAAQTLAVTLGGTSPTVTSAGKAVVTIGYRTMNV